MPVFFMEKITTDEAALHLVQSLAELPSLNITMMIDVELSFLKTPHDKLIIMHK